MKKFRLGVFGIYRGIAYANATRFSEDVELVAICDKLEDQIEKAKLRLKNDNITYYTTFDEFIKHDMDIVVLANYATEHAPFAIRCLNAGMHVISELEPCQTMKEAVELVNAAEKSGKTYVLAENACYNGSTREMKKLYRDGKIGEFLYGECEYIHDNCDSYRYNYGDPTHWRTRMYSTFYCTHSLGPIIHATGLRPVSVTGFELPCTEKTMRRGKRAGLAGVEMVTLENGSIVHSVHGSLPHYSLWWCMHGEKGTLESARFNTQYGNGARIFTNIYEDENVNEDNVVTYLPKMNEGAKNAGHDGADFYVLYNLIDYLKGNKDADIIDIYEAFDMFLPGMFAFISLLKGGVPVEIPDMRKPEEREKWKDYTGCTDPAVAGDMLWPTHHNGTPDIPYQYYEALQKRWHDFSENEKRKLEND